MNKIVSFLKQIIDSPEDINDVVSFRENRFQFNFHSLLLELGHYWSDEYETTIWFLNIYSGGKHDKPVSYTSTDLDLEGFQSYFQTAYRVVDSRFNNIDSKIDAILNKKK